MSPASPPSFSAGGSVRSARDCSVSREPASPFSAPSWRPGTPDETLATIFGLCLVGCLIEIVLSQFIDQLKRVITPTVTGVVITAAGLSVILMTLVLPEAESHPAAKTVPSPAE